MDQKQAVLGHMSKTEKARVVWTVWLSRARRKDWAPQAAWCAMVVGMGLSFMLACQWGMAEFVVPEWSVMIGYPYAVGIGFLMLAAFGFRFLRGSDAAGAARRSFLGAVFGVALVGSLYGWSLAQNRAEAIMKEVESVASRASSIRAGCKDMEKRTQGIHDSQIATLSQDEGRLARAATPSNRTYWRNEIERDRADLKTWNGKREEALAKCATLLRELSADSGLSDAARRFKMDMVVEMWAMCAAGAIFAGLAAFAGRIWSGALGGALEAAVWRTIASAPSRGIAAMWKALSVGTRWTARIPGRALGAVGGWWSQALDEGLDDERIASVERARLREAAGSSEKSMQAGVGASPSKRL